jgi:cyclic beta-1,2-glucan synthetase
MYRTLVETLLGVNRRGDSLVLTPRLPKAWASMKVHYRFHETTYHITYTRWKSGAPTPPSLRIDGQEFAGADVPLRDDGREHMVELTFY